MIPTAQEQAVKQTEEQVTALISKLTKGTMDLQDIDLQDAEYSDDDELIYFDKKTLIAQLFKLEDLSLFDINQCQQDEQALEDLVKVSELRMATMRRKLQEQESSLRQGNDLLDSLKCRHQHNLQQSAKPAASHAVQKKQVSFSSLRERLCEVGAKKDMVDKILLNLKKLLVNTDPKIDEQTSDQAEPMRRIELRVMDLYEWIVSKLRKSAEDAEEVRR